VFPLPNVFLFPGCVMPLLIFEPRYRQMIEDLLDRAGRLVMGTLRDVDGNSSGNPPILDIGGLGEIGRHERLTNGRFLIWMFGLSRVRLHEVESAQPYRLVEIEQFEDVEPSPERGVNLRSDVHAALLARSPDFLNLPDGMPLSHMVDLLAQRLQPPGSLMAESFSEADVARRAEITLAEHARHPLPPTS